MRTYFIRHSSSLDISHQTMMTLISENRIAIHYPISEVKGINWEDGDNSSLDPDTYRRTGRSAMKRLVTLIKNGGYVFAYYRGYDKCIIGKVHPSSKIDLVEGEYGPNKHKGRKAILKTVKLDKWIELDASKSILFQSVQPRQGTFCVWHAIHQRIANLVDNKNPAKDFNYLLPAEQEVMCAEFLRSAVASKFGLPTIESLKLPIGRTLKDIDIIGNGTDGKDIIVQVTHTADKHKAETLKLYAKSQNVTAIMFWGGNENRKIDNIHYMNLEKVFNAWCLGTTEGQRWLDRIN